MKYTSTRWLPISWTDALFGMVLYIFTLYHKKLTFGFHFFLSFRNSHKTKDMSTVKTFLLVYSSNYKPRSGTDTEFLINDNNAPIQIVSISRKKRKKSGKCFFFYFHVRYIFLQMLSVLHNQRMVNVFVNRNWVFSHKDIKTEWYSFSRGWKPLLIFPLVKNKMLFCFKDIFYLLSCFRWKKSKS